MSQVQRVWQGIQRWCWSQCSHGEGHLIYKSDQHVNWALHGQWCEGQPHQFETTGLAGTVWLDIRWSEPLSDWIHEDQNASWTKSKHQPVGPWISYEVEALMRMTHIVASGGEVDIVNLIGNHECSNTPPLLFQWGWNNESGRNKCQSGYSPERRDMCERCS